MAPKRETPTTNVIAFGAVAAVLILLALPDFGMWEVTIIRGTPLRCRDCTPAQAT